MNISLENFSSNIKTVDIVLYVGVAVVIYACFKEQINNIISPILNKIKSSKGLFNKPSHTDSIEIPNIENDTSDDIFFELIKSWKQTRDLAEIYGCDDAVKIADDMFPHLIPKDQKDAE